MGADCKCENQPTKLLHMSFVFDTPWSKLMHDHERITLTKRAKHSARAREEVPLAFTVMGHGQH